VHTPFPSRTAAEMSNHPADEGIMLFSTPTQSSDFGRLRLHWWYASPRNGHVSLYSTHSSCSNSKACSGSRCPTSCTLRSANFVSHLVRGATV
jgi:hypothetical protein